MERITLKDIPMELHAQLKKEAAANFRSLTQETMSRLERTFQIDAALTTKRDQKWMDESIASGPETPLTKIEMKAIRDRGVARQNVSVKRPRFLLVWPRSESGCATTQVQTLRNGGLTPYSQPFDSIEKNPFVGHERKDLSPPGIRSRRMHGFPRWLVFYAITPKKDFFFYRVRSGAMNW